MNGFNNRLIQSEQRNCQMNDRSEDNFLVATERQSNVKPKRKVNQCGRYRIQTQGKFNYNFRSHLNSIQDKEKEIHTEIKYN